MRRLLLACLLLPAIEATAQDFGVRTIDFDLAESPAGGAVAVPFPEGVMFQVRVVNVVPTFAYTFTAPTETTERAPLVPDFDPASDPCAAMLGRLETELFTATSEVDVRRFAQRPSGRSGRECGVELTEAIDSLTTYSFRVGVLARGERFTFRVRRQDVSWSLTVALASARPSEGKLYDESFAVVIGIDKYSSPEWPELSYAVKDAKSMARFLTQSGFEVIELYDEAATKQAIIGAMQNNLARRVGERDRVLVFFAGHGYTETLGGQEWGYIVPHIPRGGGDSSAGFISMEELQGQSAKMGAATHQLFIMDSCYGGTLGTRGVSPLNAGIPNYLEEVTRRPARQIITAGGKNQQVADGGPRGHSVFTGYLLEALEDSLGDLNGDGYITFSELNAYLVPRATSALQTPAAGYLPAHGLGEFTFRSPRGEPVAPVVEAPSPVTPPRPSPTAEDGYGGFTGRQAAERIVSDYLGAHLSMNLEALLSIVDFPFYFDSEILVRQEDLADRFRALFAERTSEKMDFRIESIRAKTIGELKTEGYDASRDRVLNSLFLEDADYAITVLVGTAQLGTEAILLFARRTPTGLKIVGTWD